MPQIHEIETERLLLRQWRSCDFPVFAQMNADEEVMRFFPAKLSEQESNAMAQRCRDLIEQRGWGFWAAQEKSSNAFIGFIGFIGLHIPIAALPFSPLCRNIACTVRLSPAYPGSRGFPSSQAPAGPQWATQQAGSHDEFSDVKPNSPTPCFNRVEIGRLELRYFMRRSGPASVHEGSPKCKNGGLGDDTDHTFIRFTFPLQWRSQHKANIE